MQTVHAAHALLPSGWADNVEVRYRDGRIVSVTCGVPRPTYASEHHDILLPAMPNLHSHAFQRAMAGLTELRGPGNDSFWSWRDLMYRFALSMTPDQVEAVAAQLYVEMLESGFGRVGEFHYLHHDLDGREYSNIAEMAERIGAAAADTGIALTLLPVFYAHSNFGGVDPSDGQRRFINSVGTFERMMEACRALRPALPNMRVGVAPHSLRATTLEELSRVVPMADGGPVHIHVAEQVKEVEDCVAWSGSRPVGWLLANAPVDHRWCLVHATHVTDQERADMAARGAVAGLCPITEANLGDGIFSAADFIAENGSFGIGSDSNVLVGLGDELRQLEYSQRLHQRARNVIALPGGSTGEYLFRLAARGGNSALAGDLGIEANASADFVSLDLSGHPWLTNRNVLDHLVFAGAPGPDCVWVNGIKHVEGGRHQSRARIGARFARVMNDLAGQL
jgi:formimidoylglutamate deiminase